MLIRKRISGPVNGAQTGAANGAAIPTASPPAEDNGGGGLPASLEAVKRKGRGVQRGTKRGPYDKGNRASVPAGQSTQGNPAPEGTPLFTPENAKLIVRMPFNMAVAKTGWTGWELTPAETEILATPLAVTLNTWVTIDPKWVSISLFSLALLSITGEKMILYRAAKEDWIKTHTPTPPAGSQPAPAVQPAIQEEPAK